MLFVGVSVISDFFYYIDFSVEKVWMLVSVCYGDNKICSGWLLLVLLIMLELCWVLSSICVLLVMFLVDELMEILFLLIEILLEVQECFYDGFGLVLVIFGESSQVIFNGGQDGKFVLVKYCQDMMVQVCDGKIDLVMGCEYEICIMMDILLCCCQNNLLLIGEVGVGKMVVVEGFVFVIVQGEVLFVLWEVWLLVLDVGVLLVGVSMKGEFELCLKGLLEEVGCLLQLVILFVDEVYILVGVGGVFGMGDVVNLLKLVLVCGILWIIGVIIWSEYKCYIEKDLVLIWCFQVLQIVELEEIFVMEMVCGLVDMLEKYYNVLILDEVVCVVVQFFYCYIFVWQLLDKVISLLDIVVVCVVLMLYMLFVSVQFLCQQLKVVEMEWLLLQKQEKMGIQLDEWCDVLMV